jgi:hypothetical protein
MLQNNSMLWRNFDGGHFYSQGYPDNLHCSVRATVGPDTISCVSQTETVLISNQGKIVQRIAGARAGCMLSPNLENCAVWQYHGETTSLAVRTPRGEVVVANRVSPFGMEVPFRPSWSADSEIVTFEINKRVCVYKPRSQEYRCIADGYNPSFGGRNGREILFNDHRGRIWTINGEGGQLKLVSEGPARRAAHWASNGRFIYYKPKWWPIELVILRLADGRTQRISFRGHLDDLPEDDVYLLANP